MLFLVCRIVYCLLQLFLFNKLNQQLLLVVITKLNRQFHHQQAKLSSDSTPHLYFHNV